MSDIKRCTCGQTLVEQFFDALDFDNEVVKTRGLTCPTKGCHGNTAERCEQAVADWKERNA